MLITCLIECQDQRHRLGAVLFQGRKDRAQRPASVDFGSPGVAKSSTHSPGFPANGVGVINKGFGVSYSSYNRPDVLSSPGTPSYHRHATTVVGYQKGSNSERVIPPSTGHRRHPASSTMLPYSSGRTLPSKWEDAERWIFSPNPGNALGRSIPQLWRPKSKSGPLGPPGRFGGPYSSSSSLALFLESGRVGNLTVNSPYLAGVLLPEHVCGGIMDPVDLGAASGEDCSNGRGGRFGQTNGQYPAVRSTRVSQQFGSATESYQSLRTSYESIQGTCLMLLSTIYFHAFFKFSIIARVPLKNLGHKNINFFNIFMVCRNKNVSENSNVDGHLGSNVIQQNRMHYCIRPNSLQKYPQISQRVLMSF